MENLSSLPSNIVFMGFDPGDKGFICINHKGKRSFYEMPKHKVETGKVSKKGTPVTKDEFYDKGLRDLMEEILLNHPKCEIICAIEDVHAIHGSSAEATFNFGYIVGQQRMALAFIDATVIPVSPKKWQSVMWKGFPIIKVPSTSGKTMINDTKATSLAVAQKLFPDIDFKRNQRCITEDDNKVDSLLICEYLIKRYLDKNSEL